MAERPFGTRLVFCAHLAADRSAEETELQILRPQDGASGNAGQHPGPDLDAGNRFVAILAVAQSHRQVANLRDPPTVILPVEFDRKTHAHGRTVARVKYRYRAAACTRPAPVGR